MRPVMEVATRARRRMVLGTLAAVAGSPLAALSQSILQTPSQTEGPFYPARLPADQDNDLVVVKGARGIAKGEITHLQGRVLDANGRPLQGVRVEIWQCDANGHYHHPADRASADADPNFQGFGHYVTDTDGSYGFRTIKPVPYPGRTPHVHFKLRLRDAPEFITQMYVAGHPGN